MNKLAIDVSGLAWKYRTGVQNLYWAYIQAFVNNPTCAEKWDIAFYDRSGVFNNDIFNRVKECYKSTIPRWLPRRMGLLAHLVLKNVGCQYPDLRGYVNHVYNWNIYHPKGAIGSITIPDILPLEYPEWFSPDFQQQTLDSLKFAENDAQYIFCISEYIRDRLVNSTGIKAERIVVTYPGIDPDYFEPGCNVDASAFLKKNGLIEGGYLISTGFLDPRKNLSRQIEAFSIYLERNVSSGLKYVLTGLRNDLSEDLLNLINQPRLRESVVFLGYLPGDQLRTLISNARCVMYCSLAEGFGLPIIEAMAAGTLVITSNTTSMRELAEGRGRLVCPEDIEDIALAIQEIMELPDAERRSRIDSNREFSKEFTIERWLNSHLSVMCAS